MKLFKLDLPPERVHKLADELERIVDARLEHPAIAAPLASGIVGVSAYLALEYVTAESLDSVVREFGPAPAADALRVAAQLAGALDFAGVVNIEHGAVHPRDVLLSSDDTRLTGIGVARALERVGVTPPVRRPYTAPERVAGGGWDRRADVFSLAAVMHELLWGRRPTAAGAPAADALADVPGGDRDALRAVFARGLAENPADRFATALEFAEALNEAFPNVTIAAPANRDPRPASPATETPASEPMLPLLADADSDPDATLIAPSPAAMPMSVDTFAATPDDPVLKAAEEERYRDGEVAPALVRDVVIDDAVAAIEGGQGGTGIGEDIRTEVEVRPAASAIRAELPDARAPHFGADRAMETSRSAVWPLVLALGVGVAVGFASGYGVGTRSRIDSAAVGGASASESIDAAAGAATAAAPRSTVGQTATGRSAPAGDAASPTSGREFTEGTVAAPPRGPAAAAPIPRTPATAPPRSTNASPASPIADGRLLVRSTPAGAHVTVDGRDYGSTPAAIRDLAHGAHRVRVTRDGYAAVERRVVLTQLRPAQSLTVGLTRAPSTAATAPPVAEGRYTGTLTVDSRPTGAKVYVDGRLAGSTPVSITDVRAGEHAIRLEHDGYRRWSSSVRVVAAEQNRVTASLER